MWKRPIRPIQPIIVLLRWIDTYIESVGCLNIRIWKSDQTAKIFQVTNGRGESASDSISIYVVERESLIPEKGMNHKRSPDTSDERHICMWQRNCMSHSFEAPSVNMFMITIYRLPILFIVQRAQERIFGSIFFGSIHAVTQELLHPKLAQRVLVTLPEREVTAQVMEEANARRFGIKDYIWEKQSSSPFEGEVGVVSYPIYLNLFWMPFVGSEW